MTLANKRANGRAKQNIAKWKSERKRENVYRATDMDDGILYARCQLNRIVERSLLSRCAKLSVDARLLLVVLCVVLDGVLKWRCDAIPICAIRCTAWMAEPLRALQIKKRRILRLLLLRRWRPLFPPLLLSFVADVDVEMLLWLLNVALIRA